MKSSSERTAEALVPSRSLWMDAVRRLVRDRLALVALAVVCLYTLVAIATSQGWIASPWDKIGRASCRERVSSPV